MEAPGASNGGGECGVGGAGAAGRGPSALGLMGVRLSSIGSSVPWAAMFIPTSCKSCNVVSWRSRLTRPSSVAS
eukprot:4894707-Prorocentrum_lima.AAC.1